MEKPKKITKVLVDGDIVAYRAAYSTQDKSTDEAFQKVDELMGYIEGETVVFKTDTNFEVYLTGNGNYRNDYAVTAPYKGERSSEKPDHLDSIRWYLQERWGAVVVDGIEADDELSTRVATVGKPDSTVVVSVDKDMHTLNCWHFNPTKGSWSYETKFSALQFFYSQILSGDRVDNIIGIHRVGEKTAQKLLADCKTELQLYQTCVATYMSKEGLSEEEAKERVQENGILLWLQDYKGQIWEPPNE